jgi:hypothetical protein
MLNNNRAIPVITKKLMEFLEKNGHICQTYNISSNKLEWCNSDICKEILVRNSMEELQKKQENFIKELEQKNHTCIQILESYPMQVQWCGKNPCKNNKQQE